jgi:signal transduction histidine kinase
MQQVVFDNGCIYYEFKQVMAFSWPEVSFRSIGDLLLISVVAFLLGYFLHKQRRLTQAEREERKRTANILKQEHIRRLNAERESRSLGQRLLTAHEMERARLARELHDDITQRLARLAIDAAQLERSASATTGASNARVMREELVRLSTDVHSLAYRLHPSILEDIGLVEALRAECDHFSRDESLQVGLKVREIPSDPPREAAFALFRIAQEALGNVARHARAFDVTVSLARLDGGLQLVVQDDGVGFDPAQARKRPSLGHACMKERVTLVEGELDIESAPGQGTTIVAWVPLNKLSAS